MRRLWVIVGCVLGATTAAHADDAADRLAAEHACSAHLPTCDWAATYAPFERASLARGLEKRSLTIDPAPWGKQVAKIHIYVEDVFAEKNWLRFFNVFHFTTRESALRDELTIQEGDMYSDDLVAESQRRLHDPLYTSVVVLVPVKSAEPGKVDLFLVTRDVFSLRLNTQYQFQESSLTYLSISLSENNFLGQRNLAAMRMIMDQGAIAIGPLFIDKNLLGSHLDFRVSADEVITRQNLQVTDPQLPNPSYPTTDPQGIEDGGGLRVEGHDLSIQLTRPLWSLASEWGGGATFSYSNAIARRFLGTGIRGFDDPGSMVPLPEEWRQKRTSVTANALRRWGDDFKQQVTLGYTYTSTSTGFLGNFPTDPVLRSDFSAFVLPRTENVSAPYVGYSFFTPTYKTVRNVTAYELAEDLQLGPYLDSSISQGLRTLGSDYHFTSPSISGGWVFPWCHDGSINPSAGASLRIQPFTLRDGSQVNTIDNSASASLRVVTPSTEYYRIVAQASVSTLWNSSQGQFLAIGGDPTLRGYVINQFTGQRVVSGQIELRTMPLPWWVLRLGAVAFYEVGGAAPSLGQMDHALFHDVGLGVRALIPQTSRDLFRVDVAFPLQATVLNGSAFFPHLVLSYASAY